MSALGLSAPPTPSTPTPSHVRPMSLVDVQDQLASTLEEEATAQPAKEVGKLNSVTSPSGSSLSDLHASTGTYIASYLSHWMFVLGCEYETLGKALWELVQLRGRSDDGEEQEDVDVEDAFWVWVKDTLGNSEDDQTAAEATTQELAPPESKPDDKASLDLLGPGGYTPHSRMNSNDLIGRKAIIDGLD